MREDQKAEIARNIDALTVHGLSRVASTSTIYGKLLWLIIWLLASCWMLILAHNLITKHLSRDVHLHQTAIASKTMAFPAITFCNTNYIGDLLNESLLPRSCIDTRNDDLTDSLDEFHFNKACDMFMARSEFQSCTINGNSCMFPFNFVPQRNIFPCFTFNKERVLEQSVATGPFNGLNMVLFYNESDHVNRSIDVTQPVTQEPKDGLHLNIHDQDIFSRGLINEGIPLSPGQHISISLKKIVETRKPRPFHSGCVLEEDKNYQYLFPGKHNVKLCLSSCFFLKFYKTCGAVHDLAKFLMNKTEYPTNGNMTGARKSRCLLNLMKKFHFDSCNCSIPCSQVIYDINVMSKPWPPDWFATQNVGLFAKALNRTPNEMSAEMLKKNLLKVSIFFDEFATYIREEREAYDWASLLSDMGGQMGLFLGMSFISLVEMVLLVFGLIKIIFTKSTKVNNTDFKISVTEAEKH